MLSRLLQSRAASAEQLQTGRMVAGLLLIFIGVTIASALFYLIISPAPTTLVICSSSAGLFVLLYAINRRGGTTLAAASLVGIVMAIVPVALITAQVSALTSSLLPTLLIVAVALAGILFPWRVVPLVALI